jgi:hypothetical protein
MLLLGFTIGWACRGGAERDRDLGFADVAVGTTVKQRPGQTAVAPMQ